MKTLLKAILLVGGSVLASGSYGQLAWSQEYDSGGVWTGSQYPLHAAALAEGESGNLYMLGTIQYSSTSSQMEVMKIDPANGSPISYYTIPKLGTDSEAGYDIVFGPDSKVYILGLAGANTLHVVCLNTSLSQVWSSSVVATVPGGGASTSCLPYRLVFPGPTYLAGAYPVVTTQVQSTTSNNYDLYDFTKPKAGFYARFNNSGSLIYSGSWEPVAGGANNLLGALPTTSNLVLVGGCKLASGQPVGYVSTYNQGTGASLWSQSIPSSLGWTSQAVVNAVRNRNKIYVSFTGLGGTQANSVEAVVGIDGGRSTAPTEIELTPFTIGYIADGLPGESHTQAFGVAYWNGHPTSLAGWAWSVYPDPNTVYSSGSWLRNDDDSVIGGFGTTLDSKVQLGNGQYNQSYYVTWEDGAHQYRSLDAHSTNLLAFVDSSTYDQSTAVEMKTCSLGANPLTQTVNVVPDPIAHDWEVLPTGLHPCKQVVASGASNSAYALISLRSRTNGKELAFIMKVTRT